MMQQVAAVRATAAESASVQVCLDRIEDLSVGLEQVDRLMFRMPIEADAAWVRDLTALDQPKVDTVTRAVRAVEPYNQPGRAVPLLKVMRLHTAGVLDAHKKVKAKFPSVAAALTELAGPAGREVLAAHELVEALTAKSAELKGKLAALEVEADAETTPEARKAAIPAEEKALEAQVEALEAELTPAEDKLIASVEALGQIKPAPDKLPLAKAVFQVTQHAALMQVQSGVLAATASIQTVTAIPKLPVELQALAQRWLNEALTELGGQAEAAMNITPKIEIGLDGVSLGFEGGGLDRIDLGKIKDTLFGKVGKFYDQAVAAPGAVSTVAEKVGFQSRFLVALGGAMASMAGTQFVEELPLSIPEA
jgi:hypothetical protein